jgi:hypothetical protein
LAGGFPSWTNSSILSCRVTNSCSLAPEPAGHGLHGGYRNLPLAKKACVRIPTYNGALRSRGPSVPSLSPVSDYRFQRQPPFSNRCLAGGPPDAFHCFVRHYHRNSVGTHARLVWRGHPVTGVFSRASWRFPSRVALALQRSSSPGCILSTRAEET